ncbi:hypothetical protein Tco_0394119 [Tanacetum coccineum]
MSDSEHSTVTYTSISSDYEEPSDVGSPGVMVYGYDRLPMHPPSPDYVPGPEHPPPPNYVPGPEHPLSPVYVPYVLEPAYPEFMPPEDDSNPEEDLEEDDEDPEEDPAYYPIPRHIEDEDEKEEEEHLALADSVLPPAYRITARMSIRAQTPIPFPSKAEDTDEIYERLDDTQDDRSLMSGQLNLLRRDRRSPLLRMTRLCGTLRTTTQMVALQSQQRPTRDPAHPDVPEEAGSSS